MKKNGGFTLVEMILVMSVVGILGVTAAMAFLPALNSWSLGSARSQGVESTDYALNRMIREITQLKNSQSVVTASAGIFEFVDTSNNNIRYSLSGSSLMRNSDILAKGVQSLSFSYRDINDQALATPQVSPSPTDIWRVMVTMMSLSGNQTVNMESAVHPRNLPRP